MDFLTNDNAHNASVNSPVDGVRLFPEPSRYMDETPSIDELEARSRPRTPRDIAKRGRAALDRKHGKVERLIKTVIDMAAPDSFNRRPAEAILDTLTPATFEAFRREIVSGHQNGSPRWCCGECGTALYVRGTNMLDTHGDGRGAYFCHHNGSACSLGVEGRSPLAINAERYDGAQESDEHHSLKSMLAEMLGADPAFSNVAIESVMHGRDSWRRPDVSARVHNRRIAFEVQLATMLLPELIAREEFYETNQSHLVWLTSARSLGRLQSLSFQSILWHNRGQIFAIDEEALTATLATGELHLWSLTVVPELVGGRISNIWEKRLVRRSQITFMTASRRPRFDRDDYRRSFEAVIERAVGECPERIREEVTGNDVMAQLAARSWWNAAATTLEIGSWDAAQVDGVFEAIGVLNTIVTNKKADASRYRSTTTILNNFLDSTAGRPWTAMLVETAKAYGHSYLLTSQITRELIASNQSVVHADLGRRHGLALSMLFPQLAIGRLATVPSLPGSSA